MLLRVEGLNTTYEVESFARMVFPGLRRIASEEIIPFGADSIEASVRRCDDDARLTICLHLHGQEETRCETLSAALSDKELARHLSLLLYDAAAVLTGISLRWGVLTGIRPIKLFHALLRTGKKDAEIKEEMRQRYAVQPEMSALALQIARTQQSVCGNIDYRCFSLYVSIPFCPQRCSYCSFVSQAVEHEGSLMGRYVELLCDELIRTGELVHQLGLKLQTIYFGGGTPTTLSATQLAQLFGTIERAFDLSDLLEYTVEAGRPDTIDELKLSVIKAAGVGRISVNPQTMNDHLLEAVGRRHTASDVERAFTLARRIGFQSINMDLIAGLPGDTPEGFAHSLEQVLALSPENLTVHALTLKRASLLARETDLYDRGLEVAQMIDLARQRAGEKHLTPYYLYRQKNTIGNLDNTGYAQSGSEGLYNILIMEELQTIFAVGAGAVTKLRRPSDGDIKRVFNLKLAREYINQYETIVSRKEQVRKFYEADE